MQDNDARRFTAKNSMVVFRHPMLSGSVDLGITETRTQHSTEIAEWDEAYNAAMEETK